MFYLDRVLGLLRDDMAVRVLRGAELLLLAIGDKHRGQLVALCGDQQLGPLGAEGT